MTSKTRAIIWFFAIMLMVVECVGIGYESKAEDLSQWVDEDYDASYDSYYDEELAEIKAFDPIEPVNRIIFKFNKLLDKVILKPAAKLYTKVVPIYGRNRVRDFFSNLGEPITFANSVLQGDVENAFTSLWRFLLNTSIGLGGIYDVAQEAGLEKRREDLGQTLGMYGIGGGPYLMLPLLGPSNVRDLVGTVGDYFVDPMITDTTIDIEVLRHYGFKIGKTISRRTDLLKTLNDVEKNSIDEYVTIRSLYYQSRESMINNTVSKQVYEH